MVLDDRADSFLRMIRRAQRGRLKIYLGYSAGVGKTYQMLLEGHRLKDEGIDVVSDSSRPTDASKRRNLLRGLKSSRGSARSTVESPWKKWMWMRSLPASPRWF